MPAGGRRLPLQARKPACMCLSRLTVCGVQIAVPGRVRALSRRAHRLALPSFGRSPASSVMQRFFSSSFLVLRASPGATFSSHVHRPFPRAWGCIRHAVRKSLLPARVTGLPPGVDAGRDARVGARASGALARMAAGRVVVRARRGGREPAPDEDRPARIGNPIRKPRWRRHCTPRVRQCFWRKER